MALIDLTNVSELTVIPAEPAQQAAGLGCVSGACHLPEPAAMVGPATGSELARG